MHKNDDNSIRDDNSNNSTQVESQKIEEEENENMEDKGKININFLSNDEQITDFIKTKYLVLKEEEDEKILY